MGTKIKVTDDKQKLREVWGYQYAQDHAGKTYDAVIDKRGWAVMDGVDIPPTCYVEVKKNV